MVRKCPENFYDKGRLLSFLERLADHIKSETHYDLSEKNMYTSAEEIEDAD